MANLVLVVPVRPGKSEHWRRYIQELQETSHQKYREAHYRYGISRELCWLVNWFQTELVILYFETAEPGSFLEKLSRSDNAFDRRFLEQLQTLSGVEWPDIRQFCQGELLLEWAAPLPGQPETV